MLLLFHQGFAQERGISAIESKTKSGLKHALVVGNADYQHKGRLRNPLNDARAISSTLRELGFEVTTLENADKRMMERSFREFGRTLVATKATGLFFYAGHGMQVKGENYLLPVDINPKNEDDIRYDAVPLGKLMGQFARAENRMNLVILDACRNNPFVSSFRSINTGWAQLNAPNDTFIAYATSPGQVAADGEGSNGLFTSKLLEHMKSPGLKVEEVFKRVRIDVQKKSSGNQTPWDSSSLTAEFYFAQPLESTKSLKPSQEKIAKLFKDSVPEPTNSPASQSSSKTPPVDSVPKSVIETNTADEKARREWDTWQARMQEKFSEISNSEKTEVDLGKQIKSWEKFLMDWAANNLYTDQDEKYRMEALKRIEELVKTNQQAKDDLKEKTVKVPTEKTPASTVLNKQKNKNPISTELLPEEKLEIVDHKEKSPSNVESLGLNPEMEEKNSASISLSKAKTQSKPSQSTNNSKSAVTIGKFIKLPDTKAKIGSNMGDPDELPVKIVKIEEYFISSHEITIGEFAEFIEATNYKTTAEKNGLGCRRVKKGNWFWDPNLTWRNELQGAQSMRKEMPVTCVSWLDVQEFADWKNTKSAEVEYHLCSEAQWESAAKFENSSNIDHVGWYLRNSSGKLPESVGTKKPNTVGIYDLLGNVWEWTSDAYCGKYSADCASKKRSVRGGSFLSEINDLRPSNRFAYNIDYTNFNLGARLCASEKNGFLDRLFNIF